MNGEILPYAIKVALVLCTAAIMGYPIAYLMTHGVNPETWPNASGNPYHWLGALCAGDFQHLVATYFKMVLAQSPNLAGGGRLTIYIMIAASFVLSFLLIYPTTSRVQRHQSKVYGNARWANDSEITTMRRGLEIGVHSDTKRRVRVALESNLVTFAPPRSGKTNGLIIPNLACADPQAWGGPAVVVDPKGDVFRAVRRRRRAMGRTVRCIDPLDLVGGKDRWNPLWHAKVNDVLYLQSMARALVPLGEGVQDNSQYFRDRAVELIVGALIASDTGNGLDPVHAAALLENPEEFRTRLLKRSDKASRTALAILNMDEKSRDPLLSSAGNGFMWIRDECMQAVMSDPTFDLADLASGDVDLFIVLPADDRRDIIAPFVRWLLADFVTAMRENRPLERIVVFIDEAFVLGRFDAVLRGSGELPGYGVSLWTFWQSRAQMMETYGEEGSRTLIANAALVNVFSIPQADPDEKEHWSKAVGSYTGVSAAEGRDLHGRKTRSETAASYRLIAPEALVEELQTKQLVFVNARGYTTHPLLIGRVLAHEDARFTQLVDLDPPVGR